MIRCIQGIGSGNISDQIERCGDIIAGQERQIAGPHLSLCKGRRINRHAPCRHSAIIELLIGNCCLGETGIGSGVIGKRLTPVLRDTGPFARSKRGVEKVGQIGPVIVDVTDENETVLGHYLLRKSNGRKPDPANNQACIKQQVADECHRDVSCN